MLKINGKTFMNLQEAVQWLLDNNALPFQSSANYVANTEIGMSTIVNPSPAKVRIGSLIFFADSKVSTVIGITENGFICSDQYNNLVDDVAYVTGVSIDASGHLITTLSDGQTIDAGIVKQVSGFSINASQHLIVSFNDGTSTDLGAIFNGSITISGNLTVTGSINGEPTPSLKPIYFHPLTIYSAGVVIGAQTYKFFLSASILNNSPSQLSGSLADVQSYVAGHFNRLNVSGVAFRFDDLQTVHAIQLYIDASHIYLVGIEQDGTTHDEGSNQIDLESVKTSIYVIDGPNKIN